MKIKLSIPVLQSLKNNEIFVLVSLLSIIKNNPKQSLDNIIRVTSFRESAVERFIKVLEYKNIIKVNHSYGGNSYYYIDPIDNYIEIDTSIININAERVNIGVLIKLMTYANKTNIISLTLKDILKSGIPLSNLYSLIRRGYLYRPSKRTLSININ